MEDGFLQYQLMRESDTPECVWQSALVEGKDTTPQDGHHLVSHEIRSEAPRWLANVSEAGSSCTSGTRIAPFQCRRGTSFQVGHEEQDQIQA